ncbi:hypothetical protein TNCV_3580931 [Trichonephila clavipes]|nr:hypothetical protein TNCV_3580931 [Trichonephila clavipes]
MVIYGDHAQASSTTLRIIMSDTSEQMEFSSIKFEQVAACEKLRYSNRYLSSSQVATQDGRTFTQPQEFLQGLVPIKHTNHDQEKGGIESDKEFEFYVIKRQNVKPIKAVIKGLPSSSKIANITNDLAEIGFKIDSCTQLTSKRTKISLPYFLVILPRNDYNSKILDIAKLGYLQLTAVLQSMITSIADVSCTLIGPPLLNSRPPLQAQVSKTMNIRVPDRGLKAADTA